MQPNLPQFTFKWPKGPETVILTGGFDEWKGTLPMVKDPNGAFEITLPIKFDSVGSKVYFKFIVDGQWLPNKDYKVIVDGGVENNFITEDDVMQQYGNNTGMLVPESGGLVVTKNTTLIEPEAEKPAKLRKFKIKRVIKTNKQTGERSIFSQEVIEVPESEDEAQKVDKTSKNADGLSGTTTIIENNSAGVTEEKAVKPYEEGPAKLNFAKNEKYITDGLGKTKSSESRLYELSAEELENEEEEEDEDKDTGTNTEGEDSELQSKKSLSIAAKIESSPEKLPVGLTTSTAKETSRKSTGEVIADTQTFEPKPSPTTAATEKVEVKKATTVAKPSHTKRTPKKDVQKSPVKKEGFFKKLSKILK